MTNVFIDGSAGTTGLRIYERLSSRRDINLVTLPDELRKDINCRRDALNSADIAFLCLPDDAARQAVSLITNPNVAVIDTSTAHRTLDGWQYGFAELGENFEKIKGSKRIANPGCHASGFIALVKPLIYAGVLSKDTALSCFSLTGYSGGGKKMIEEYEADSRSPLLKGPRMYALTQQHKHLAEMVKICGLSVPPVFCPVVGDFYSGMQVSVPLFKNDIKCDKATLKQIYNNYYKTGLVKPCFDEDENFLSAVALSGRDDMKILVTGNDDRIVLVAVYDNLGKGASGSAIENMNILLGLDASTGLCTQND